MLNRLNIDARMARNDYYSLFIFERSILRQERGTLSGAPGFVVIAVMETGIDTDRDILEEILAYQVVTATPLIGKT
jgi:hypothetical protein